MSDDLRAGTQDDFLGAFAVVERGGRILMVQNERRLGGELALTWDLPGGRVEPGELLREALARELREETGLVVRGVPAFLFVQEGERLAGRRRTCAWRSFFFHAQADGEPRPAAEVRAVRWFLRAELPLLLTAPYHRSFLDWLRDGGRFYEARWPDGTVGGQS
jgi:8-oxo-dGTP diphosphatase